MRILFLLLATLSLLSASKYDKVKITPDISYVLVYHKGSSVKVHRVQNVKHRLTGEYAKTFHPCSGECLQPISLGNGIKTIGEVEIVESMKKNTKANRGILIDARTKADYDKETIPTAANIPYTIGSNTQALNKLFVALGLRQNSDLSWDGEKATELIFFSNGPWCDKASKLIKRFVQKGYPVEKIKYYRGGFQMWKILGFTAVVSKEVE